MTHASRYAAALRTGRWFAELPASLQQALLDAAQVRALGAGERLFSRGDPAGGLCAVVQGAVRVGAFTDGGREVLLTRFEAPAWFGEIAVFDRQPRTHDCVADDDAVVLVIPLSALDAILAAQPAWWRDLGVLLAGKLRLSFHILEEVAVLPLAARLARRLLVLADGHGEWIDKQMRVVALSQEQLASMLSSSRQTVNAVLKDFEGRGLVRVSYGQIELRDVDGLRAAASGLAAGSAASRP